MIRPSLLLPTLVLLAAAAPAVADDRCPPPVWVERAHSDERAELRLVDCEGAPYLDSLDELSLLARPTGTPRPSAQARAVFEEHAPAERRERFVSPGIRRLDPGLLVRLQAVAAHFGHKPLSIVSGYRPRARRGSRHRHGRALDVAVEGVPRREVALFARSLPETGVGYYPNSTFTHIDVREESYHWVDLSQPGEASRYVAWAEAFGEETPPENEPTGGPATEPALVAAASPSPATPSASSADASTHHPSDDVVVAAASLEEVDDAGRPLDVASTSAEARDAIRAHREARSFGPADDAAVDWSLPWW